MTPGQKLRLGMLVEAARSIADGGTFDEELLAFMRQEDVEVTFMALHSALARLREAIELTQTSLEVGLFQLAPYWNDYPEPGTWDPHGEPDGNNPHAWTDVTGREWTADDIRWMSTRHRSPARSSFTLFQPNLRFKDPETGKYVLNGVGGVPFAGGDGSVAQDPNNLFWDNSNKRMGIGTQMPATRTLYVVDAQCTCGIFKSAWDAHCARLEEIVRAGLKGSATVAYIAGLVNRDVQ